MVPGCQGLTPNAHAGRGILSVERAAGSDWLRDARTDSYARTRGFSPRPYDPLCGDPTVDEASFGFRHLSGHAFSRLSVTFASMPERQQILLPLRHGFPFHR